MNVRRLVFIVILMAMISSHRVTHAGTRIEGFTDEQARANAAPFDSVGLLLGKNFLCSGTLIADEWVLSAAHCLDRGKASHFSFEVGDDTFTGSQKFVHPAWSGNLVAGNDIALLKLSIPSNSPPTVTPSNLWSPSNGSEVGKQAVAAGFGRGGTGVTGAQGSAGVKRAGSNMIDATGDQYGLASGILLLDFDDPINSQYDNGNNFGLADPISEEYSIAPGDSGGPLFVHDGSEYLVAGVHSFGWGRLDGDPNADYDDAFGSTKVSDFLPWIESIISPSGGGDDGGGTDSGGGGRGGGRGGGGGRPFNVSSYELTSLTAPVPEPASGTMALLAFFGLTLLRCRRAA